MNKLLSFKWEYIIVDEAHKLKNEDVDPLNEVGKQVLAILNKLTTSNFDILKEKLHQIEIDTEAKRTRATEVIFVKVLSRLSTGFFFEVQRAK